MENLTKIGILKINASLPNSKKIKFDDENMIEVVTSAFTNSEINPTAVISSEQDVIESTLTSWISNCNVILTMGGIGILDTDNVPEATKAVIEKDLTSLIQPLVSQISAAVMCRTVCGIKSKCLILNLPENTSLAALWLSELKITILQIVNSLVHNKVAILECSMKNLSGSKVKIEELEKQTEITEPLFEAKAAFQKMLSEIHYTLEHDIIPLNEALNRIVVNDIIAKKPIQTIDNSVALNSLIIKKRDKITEKHLSILPVFGYNKVKVFKRPQISVISVGTKVKSFDDKLETGQFFDTNKILIINKLKKYGYQSTDCGIANSPDSLKRKMMTALSTHDVIVTSGGVSKNDHMFLKHVLIEDFDAVVHFEYIKMNSIKNVIFATLLFKGKLKYVFGFPGNPDHASVSTLLFVIPALRYMERNINYEFPEILIKTERFCEYEEVYVDIIDNQFYYRKDKKGSKAKCLLSPNNNDKRYCLGLLIEY